MRNSRAHACALHLFRCAKDIVYLRVNVDTCIRAFYPSTSKENFISHIFTIREIGGLLPFIFTQFLN